MFFTYSTSRCATYKIDIVQSLGIRQHVLIKCLFKIFYKVRLIVEGGDGVDRGNGAFIVGVGILGLLR